MPAALGDLSALSEALAGAAAEGARKLEARRRPPKGLGRGGVVARQKIMCVAAGMSAPFAALEQP